MAMTKAGRRILEEMRVHGSQLELPWGGRSPRTLTRAFELFSLSQERTTVNEEAEFDDALIDEQCRRHLHGS